MKSEKVAVPGCKGTTVQNLLSEEGLQILKVEVGRGGEIPLHSHECTATMVVIKGKARALGKSGQIVSKGDVVVKSPNEPHGFTDIEEPFCFISISDNKGIMLANGWDMKYLPQFREFDANLEQQT
jgi:quercetin dioxygenase-like cupin family protein